MQKIGRWWRGAALGTLLVVGTALAAPALAQATALKEFSSGLGGSPAAIVSGPDGNLWFLEPKAIDRITPAGTVTRFTNGLNAGSAPFDMTLGPDGNLWFSDIGTTKAIGRITPAGVIKEFTTGLNPGAVPENMVAGADGNVWFLDLGSTKAIGRVTPAGVIKEFSSGLNSMSQANDITLGPDGNLWFTDQGNTKAIGRVKPDGKIDEFSGGLTMTNFPNAITAGADGDLYFSDDGSSAIGRVTTTAPVTITELTNGVQSGAQPDALTLGPDGNVWFIDQLASQRAIGRVPPAPATTVKEFTSGLTDGLPLDITVGLDGNLWVPQTDNGMAMTPSVARVTPAGAITEFTNGLNPMGLADGDSITSGPDGNLWFTDSGSPKAIGRVALQMPASATTGAASAVTTTTATVSGLVTPLGAPTAVTFQYGTTPALGSSVSAGTLAASVNQSAVGAGLTGLPSGTVIYYRVVADNGSGATTGAVQTLTTAAAPQPTPPGPPSPPAPPSPGSPGAPIPIVPPASSTATVGNQLITVTTPAPTVCTPSGRTLAVTVRSTAIAGSHAAKLRFVSAALYLDRGVKHTHKKTVRGRHGKKKTVTVTVFKANAVVHRVPASLKLALKGLRSGQHTLTVKLSYTKTVIRHGHKRNVGVSKTRKAKLRVC